ncbi:MAG: prepilin-type N-terminal cleavage/methylation domain-containing protein [Gemmatimonadales bacterium]|nr:MAG: prepilin-type N-terminal cleavage/methylation domain-containing protein [Gemmatimonadales bacterium]
MRREVGFTLIELMIVVVVIGILAAVAIPNFVSMGGRAREAGVKANMHTFQLAAEDYSVQNDGSYASSGSVVVSLTPGGSANFKNSFTGLSGAGVAWEDRGTYAAPASPVSGITSYSDSNNSIYNVKGHGKSSPLTIILTSGN